MIKFLTFLALVISTNAAFPYQARITEGEIVAKIEDAPYQVSIKINNKLVCGGVIISEYFVLTAAACIETLDVNRYVIRAGSLIHNFHNFYNYNGSEHSVNRLIVHENFFTNVDRIPVNDIALIQVRNPFFFNGFRDAVPLLNKHSAQAGSPGKIFGWGLINNSSFPAQLRKGEVELFDRDSCSSRYFSGRLPQGQICAVSKSKVPCQKDAGGPLVVGVHLVGIISWGRNCNLDGVPSVFTDVLFYRDWITHFTGNLNVC